MDTLKRQASFLLYYSWMGGGDGGDGILGSDMP